MGRDDWYRQTDWTEPARKMFFEKLSRARSQRDQYLVIQALTLVPYHPDVTLELIDLYLDSRTNDFDDARALWAQAQAHWTLGQLSDAVESYKSVLGREEVFPNFKTRAGLELPYLVATEELSSEYEFALETLQREYEELVFPQDAFEWHAAGALIAAAQGRADDATRMAEAAIEAAGTQESGVRYHQDLGLVGEEDREVIVKLTALARGNRPPH